MRMLAFQPRLHVRPELFRDVRKSIRRNRDQQLLRIVRRSPRIWIIRIRNRNADCVPAPFGEVKRLPARIHRRNNRRC